jgi:hypothetical protein
LDRAILCLCTGERTIPQIAEKLMSAKIEGDAAAFHAEPEAFVRDAITRLHQYALFVA